jgi:hypothetical protein
VPDVGVCFVVFRLEDEVVLKRKGKSERTQSRQQGESRPAPNFFLCSAHCLVYRIFCPFVQRYSPLTCPFRGEAHSESGELQRAPSTPLGDRGSRVLVLVF